jgi:hypothetical protein
MTQAKDINEPNNGTSHSSLVCEMAMTCRMTFDVDNADIMHVIQLPEDISELLLCAITLYDNQPPQLDQAPQHLQSMLCRDRRLAHKLQRPLLDGNLSLAWNGFDLAITHIWSAYRPSQSRSILQEGRWMHVQTVSANEQSQRVDYDIVDGRLLIDGKPMGRLPRDYVTHPTYVRTFGSVCSLTSSVLRMLIRDIQFKAILDVIPGIRGMEYTTPCSVRGEYAVRDATLRI